MTQFGTPPSTRLILVRHGRGQPQDAQLVGGPRGDTGLTDIGLHQMERCTARLARWPGVQGAPVYSSTLARARESAAILAKAIGATSITEHCDLCSYHVLDHHDGRPPQEMWDTAHRGGGVALFRPEHEGGDTWGQLALRAAHAYHEIADSNHGKTSVLVTHNETIQASLIALGYAPFRNRLHTSLANGSSTEWITHHDTTAGGPADNWTFADWTLVRWNDTGHLED